MRPEILNPLFADVQTLSGVGKALARPLGRLKLDHLVDLLFHLPSGWIDRKPVETLDMEDAGRVVTVTVTPVDYRQGGPRSPLKVHATDKDGNYLSLVYFNNPGWGKKQLPLNQPRTVSGRMELYGQELQIVHPDFVLEPGKGDEIPTREPIYALSEGLTNRRIGQLAAQALERAPELPEWIEPSLVAREGWPAWREAIAAIHADPADEKARRRLGYDEIFANQLAFALVRADSRRRKGQALRGDGRLRDALKLPYEPTGAQTRTISEIEGDLAQDVAMLRLLQGDVGSGKTLVAVMALLVAVEAGFQGAFLAPTEILARQHYDT
ncbi:MAG: ATP-dependent DNA helicase RecG, partial [Sphingomonadales bacterium]|nr:ATP-dependent DNA helicase RecG [Sphingomonadales bacterium]